MKKKGKEYNRIISLPDIPTVHNIKQFPRYSSILERRNGEGVGIEEIDSLQMEIETLLVNALQRVRTFQIELMILDNKPHEKTDLIQSKSRYKSSNLQSSINGTVYSNTELSQQTMPNSKRFRGSTNSFQRSSSTFTYNLDENSLIIRNDISDIFWNMVLPYFNEITEEDLKFLKEQIEINNKAKISVNKDLKNFSKHYCLKWTEDDINNEIKESNRLNLDINENVLLQRKRKNFSNFFNELGLFQETNEHLFYGPLTQRLISALIEQNLMTQFNISNNQFETEVDDQQSIKKNSLIIQKEFQSNTTKNNIFESKIREELIEQGILDKNDVDFTQDYEKNYIDQQKNEIIDEIQKIRNEFILVSEKCKEAQMKLLNAAKQSIIQQNIRKKIDHCDQKILELYTKNLTNKHNKKYLTRKDKDRLSELLKERDVFKQQMNKINL